MNWDVVRKHSQENTEVPNNIFLRRELLVKWFALQFFGNKAEHVLEMLWANKRKCSGLGLGDDVSRLSDIRCRCAL